MTISVENLLVCSTAGKIYALNKTDGSQIWKSDLSGIHDGVASLFVSSDKVYIGMNGFLVALNLVDGMEVWRNSLAGMGYNEVSLLVTTPNPEEGTSSGVQNAVVIVASYGKVCGLTSDSGDILWKNGLKDGGYDLPSIILDSSDTVLVGCGKKLYKINIRNGKTIWQKKISKCLFGCSYVTMATNQSSLQNSFMHAGFCNNPIAQHSIKDKEEKKYGAFLAIM
ncbi:quinon protein alcohol dehydrogenase-like superfamily, partial [Glomus cerebriforme]